MLNSSPKMLRSSLYFGKLIQKNINSSSCIMNAARQLETTGVVRNQDQSRTTVTQSEVDQHSKQMDGWWNPMGPMKALHTKNELRVPFVRDGLVQCAPEHRTKTPLAGKKILDVGCGGGILSEPLAKLGARVTGLDASKELISLAQRHSALDPRLLENPPNYVCSTIEDHASQHKNLYDGVVASEIIEHIDNKELFVRSCVDALKPGGRIFFTTPSRTRLAQIGGIYIAEYLLNIIPRGTHQYEKFMTPNELTFLLEKNDCHVELVHGAYYNVITNKWKFIESTAFLFYMRAVKLEPSPA